MVGEHKRAAGLTRPTIVHTALGLLDQVGLDGLTVRRLAAALGVQSPALYWHFRSKQQLLDQMADAIIQAAGMGPPHQGESWQDWLARRARAYRRSLHAHRDGARLVAGAQWLNPATIRTFDRELAAMVDRGFTPVLAPSCSTAAPRPPCWWLSARAAARSARRPSSTACGRCSTAPLSPWPASAPLARRGRTQSGPCSSGLGILTSPDPATVFGIKC